MTFIPTISTILDPNNTGTTTSSSFVGTSTSTNGYNTIIVSVESTVDSVPLGLEIQFSEDGSTFTTYYSDTYFASSIFTKKYTIIKKYYRVYYTSSSSSVTSTIYSRLSTDSDSSAVSPNTSIFNNNIENTLDAFGKLRVSNPYTLLDLKIPYSPSGSANFRDNNYQISSSYYGTFSSTVTNTHLTINGTGVGYYTNQSRNYCVYQPGKSLLFLASGIINPNNVNFIARIGYFNNTISGNTCTVSNGVYFECNGGIMSVHIKNLSETIITQSNWNIDTMDGNGSSGLNLDFTKTQLFVIDMEWLGVGRVRFGFYAYGRIHYCHQITNINILTSPYTNTINLPISYSLVCTNLGTGGSASIVQICSTVISEGGYNPIGRPFCISTDSTSVSVSGTETPILAIRGGGSNYKNQTILPISVSVVDNSTNDFILYKLRLYLGGTNISATWSNVDNNYSVCQYSIGTNITVSSTTGSILLDQQYFSQKGISTLNQLDNIFNSQVLSITSDILGNSDVLVLSAITISGTGTLYATMNWQEYY